MKRFLTLLCCCIYIGISAETPRSIYTDEGVEINGVVWATRNVDMPGTFAENPESFGMLFQWNRWTAWNTTDNNATGWDNTVATGDTWETENDPCPTGWRIPTTAEQQSLIENQTLDTVNGVRGWSFRCGENSVFFPNLDANHRRGSDGVLVGTVGRNGNYWGERFRMATCPLRASVSEHVAHRNYGFSVRCVRKAIDSVAMLQDSIAKLHQQLSAYRTKNITLNQTIVEWFEITENLLDSIDWLREMLAICENNSTNIVGEHVGSPLQVFPNPVTNVLHITHEWQSGDVVELFDMNGRRVFAQPVGVGFARPDGDTFTIDMTQFPNGNYILRIGNRVAKIVKR